MNITPLHLEIVLHYNACGGEFPRLDAPACASYAGQLFAAGILMDGSGRKYDLAEKGRAWLHYMLNTPLPIQAWVLPESLLKRD